MIVFAKFFQHVEIPTGKGKTPKHTASSPEYNIQIDGVFVRVTHVESGSRVTTTLNNLCYFREADEPINTTAAPAAKKPGKPKREPNPVV